MVIRQYSRAPIASDRERTRPDGLTTTAEAAPAAIRISRLAAELSHDLRVPLSTIIASLELLEEQLGEHTDPEVAALFDRATTAVHRMLRMLDQNMVVSPMTVPRTIDVDLDKVANQLALDTAPLLERAGATLKIGRLPVVRALPDEMYSVLQNLLTNAVKFTRPGVRPWVTISAKQIPYGWRVSVTDNGIGIPAQRRMDVFTLFSRVDSDVEGNGVEGHGIGLSAVAHAVHDLGGRVGAEEAPGGGAEVWFELPSSSSA